MRKYRPSNQTPFGGFLLLLLLGGVGSAAVGGILFALDYYAHIYLVFVFPIFAGALVGGLLGLGVRVGKVRSPFTAGFVGLLAGLLLYGAYHFASYYVGFRSDVRAAYAESKGKTPTDVVLDRQLDLLLQDEVGDTGFVGYLRFAAKTGLSITRTSYSSSSDSPVELKDTGVWLYWGAELLIAVGFAAVLAVRQAGQPFDEEANEWYGKPALLALTTTKSRKALLSALKDGDFQQAGSLLTTEGIKYPRTELYVRRSPNPASSAMQQDVFVTVNYAQRKGRTTVQRSGVLSPSELNLLQLAMTQTAAHQAPIGSTRASSR